MPKYRVWFTQTASTFVDIEADSPEEASDNAEPHGTLCHHCSRDVELSGDWMLSDGPLDEAVELLDV